VFALLQNCKICPEPLQKMLAPALPAVLHTCMLMALLFTVTVSAETLPSKGREDLQLAAPRLFL
jgi:hypothetical protein